MDLIELKVEIPTGSVEEADTLMQELGVEGWTTLEDVIVKRAWVVGLFPSEPEARERWAELRGLLSVKPLGSPEVRKLRDEDWRDSYKAHFKAWQFGRLHWVPVWEKPTYKLPKGDKVLWLDPGLAFGTGNHETTRLCVERLVSWDEVRGAKGLDRRGARIIDAGCGSGILALSAAKLGYRGVAGFDNDPEAVLVSEENAGLNGLAGKVEFFVGDLTTGLQGRQADMVMANILADVLIRFASELTRSVAPGGALVLSGILAAENAEVRAAFAKEAPGWPMEHRLLGEWSDVVLTRPSVA